jgi:hypothetical protein
LVLSEIGESAFALSGLSNIVIPASVRVIGKCSFFECGSLASVSFEEEFNLREIADRIFMDRPCEGRIEIPRLGTVADVHVTSCAGPIFCDCYRPRAIAISQCWRDRKERPTRRCPSMTALFTVMSIAPRQVELNLIHDSSELMPRPFRVARVNQFHNCGRWNAVPFEFHCFDSDQSWDGPIPPINSSGFFVD